MGRTAVFVDAGYLFAQGSVILNGAKVTRSRIMLDEPKVVDLLAAFAEQCGGVSSLLRVYWYDASPLKGINANHIRLGELDNVKMRLGIVNAFNEQKGVDSLLIADLIQLSHNRAIDSAVLVSGDEDLRVGVQVAQTYGVRVHLLGLVGPQTKPSQSQALVGEADTRTLWTVDVVESFMTISPAAPETTAALTVDGPPAAITGEAAGGQRPQTGHATGVVTPPPPPTFVEANPVFGQALATLVAGFTLVDLSEILTVYNAQLTIPYTYDRKLLKVAREAAGRDLDFDEKRYIRACLVEAVRARDVAEALAAATAEGLPIVE